MTRNERVADVNWIHLGYIASNSASVLVPLSRGTHLVLSKRDHSQLRQTIDFLDAAVDGLGSFAEPSLLFNKREAVFRRPAGALEIAASTYAAVKGGPVSDPTTFREDLTSYKTTLSDVLEGTEPREDAITGAVSFLNALMERARSELQASSHRHMD